MRVLQSLLLASLALASASEEKCAVGSREKYAHKNSLSLLAAAAPAEKWGDEAGEGLQELSTIEDVDNVVASTPCIIMFYAEWCPHCKRMKPIFHQVATHVAVEHYNKDIGVKFYMVNADAYRDIGGAYGVNGYPTIKYFAGQGLDKVGKEYEGGESDPPEKLENFARDEHARAGNGPGGATKAAATTFASTQGPGAVPAACDAAACDGLACPEGWATTINEACKCKCARATGASAAATKFMAKDAAMTRLASTERAGGAATAACDKAACDGLACPEGWSTTMNEACKCKCARTAGARVNAKANSRA